MQRLIRFKCASHQPSPPCRSSRRTMIWHEVERCITTDDGQPLDPERAAGGPPYPFSEVGVLRCVYVWGGVGGPENGRMLLRRGGCQRRASGIQHGM